MGVLHDQQGVEVQFLGIADKLSLEFTDPAYAKAERVLYNRESRDVHAIMHEGIVFLGNAPEALAERFESNSVIEMIADHYAGNQIRMNAMISVV